MQEDFISYPWINLLGKDCGGTKWRLNGEEEMCASWKRGEGVKAEIQTKEKRTHKSTFSTFSPKNGSHIILIGNKMQIRKETWRCLDYSFSPFPVKSVFLLIPAIEWCMSETMRLFSLSMPKVQIFSVLREDLIFWDGPTSKVCYVANCLKVSPASVFSI